MDAFDAAWDVLAYHHEVDALGGAQYRRAARELSREGTCGQCRDRIMSWARADDEVTLADVNGDGWVALSKDKKPV